jgi:hypothetical protein
MMEWTDRTVGISIAAVARALTRDGDSGALPMATRHLDFAPKTSRALQLGGSAPTI